MCVLSIMQMLFVHFGYHFRFLAPKLSKIYRVYKVFSSTFPDAPKPFFTNGFLMFCQIEKRTQLLLLNPMLFDTFRCHLTKMDPKVSKIRLVRSLSLKSLGGQVFKSCWSCWSRLVSSSGSSRGGANKRPAGPGPPRS